MNFIFNLACRDFSDNYSPSACFKLIVDVLSGFKRVSDVFKGTSNNYFASRFSEFFIDDESF